MKEHPFADAEQNLEHYLDHEKILKLRSQGVSREEIARQLNLCPRAVYKAIKQAVDEAREKNTDLVHEMFVVHQLRLEYLYFKVYEAISESPYFDDKLARAAIMILERQSRLLDLDRGSTNQAKGKNDWLESATQEQLVTEMKRLGIVVPDKFQVPVVKR